MVLTSLQVQTLINCSRHLNIDQLVQMVDLNYVLIPFEGNKNPGYTTGLKLYLQRTNNIDK